MFEGNKSLRKAGEKINYTQDMVNEIVKCKSDIIYFAEKYYTIVTIDGGKQNIALWNWQKKVLKAYMNPPNNKKNIILKIARQSGKCVYIDSIVRIRNKRNDEIKEIKIGDFYKIPNHKKIKPIDNKFIESFEVEEWEVETNSGWKDITHIHKTIKFDIWEVITEKCSLKCADDHIVMINDFKQKFVKDLIVGVDKVITKNGLEKVTLVQKLDIEPQEMYDITVKSDTHTLYTNNILSHNTTITTIFLLWYVLFNKDKTAAIMANKEALSIEILDRIKIALKFIPMWLQQGIVDWNKKSVVLENGSRIIAAATSSQSLTGFTINLLYLDEFAKVPQHIADDFIASTYPVITSGKTSMIIMVSCVSKDTFIVTPDGIKEISDFIDYSKEYNPQIGYNVKEYEVMGKNKFNKGNIVVNNGYTKTKKIRTISSFIECSYEHPFFINRNGKYIWVKAKDLTENDYLAIRYGDDKWGSDDSIIKPSLENRASNSNIYDFDSITEDLAYLLGLYLSEGSACRRKTKKNKIYYTGITITCGDSVEKILKILNFKYTKCGIHYTINSKFFCDILISLGFDLNKKAKEKIIPKRLFLMSKKNIIALLQGIMDGDGSSHSTRGIVTIGLSSKRMIEQIRALLNNFGILSLYQWGITKPSKKVKVYSNCYRLELNKTMSKLYYSIIGFRFERKQKNQKLLPENITRDRSDIIPFSKINIRNMKETDKNAYNEVIKMGLLKGNYKRNNHFNRSTMLKYKEFLLELNISSLNDMLENTSNNLKWEKIKSIEESQNIVYDFSLYHNENDKWCHSILFNNIVSSNTPFGMNHFYKFWMDATRKDSNTNSFYPISVGWWEVPGRDENFKKAVIKDIGRVKWQQEYGTQFLGSSSTLIDPDILERIVYKNPVATKWTGLLLIYEQPQNGFTYVLGVDSGKGTGRDYSVIQILKIINEHNIEQVALYRNNFIRPHDFSQVVVSIAQFYNNAYIMIENNDIGQSVCDNVWYELEYENLVNVDMKGLGIRSTKSSKRNANALLKEYVEKHWLNICDERTVYELSRYEEVKPNVFAAGKHEHDDAVTSLLWALFFVKTEEYDSGNEGNKTITDEYNVGRGNWDEKDIEVKDDKKDIDGSGGEGDPNWQPSAIFV
ncbi:MAG: LAGLIDADG family homing endonuclease [Candidatus Nanoarchaeia archaeon]|nr:LAGLIDADG family homing endonuclease [Candidatus Nanoarchaeia archaeon]